MLRFGTISLLIVKPAWRVGLFMGLVAKLDGHKVLGKIID